MVPGTAGGEIELTQKQVDALQALTKDTVIGGLQAVVSNATFQKWPRERQTEYVQKKIIVLRARARSQFRAQMKKGSATTPSQPSPNRLPPGMSIQPYQPVGAAP